MRILIKIGYTAGGIYLFMTLLWYYIKYPNINEFLGNAAIAILIMAFTYLYDRFKILDGKFDYFEDKVQDFVKGGKK